MKKYLLAVIMVVMLVSPALAGQMVRSPMVINGNTYMVDAVNQDNHFYVPLRFIAEYLGADVDWINNQVIINTLVRPTIVDDSGKITSVVNQALDLLEKYDPADYEMICHNCKSIEYYGNSIEGTTPEFDAFASATPDLHRIMIFKKFAENDHWFFPPIMAGILVHESTHLANKQRVERYQDENLAYLREIAAFRALEAPQVVIDEREYARKMVLNQLIK